MRIPSGSTNRYIPFVALDATDLKTREIGLSSFTVVYSRNNGADTAFTTPTVVEIDAATMPGVYWLLADEGTTLDAGHDEEPLVLHITHAGMASVTREVELFLPKATEGRALAIESDGDLTEVRTLTGHTAQSGDNFPRIGAPIGASISADIAAVKSETAILVARLTSARAGYLDNLNVGGAVASQADVTALNQSASRRLIIITVGQYERPETGDPSVEYTVEARTYDGDGAAVNADSPPTLTATGPITGDLSANLSAVSNPATGLYQWTYTVAGDAELEQIRFGLSATIGASTFTISTFTQVADFVAATFSTVDRSNIEDILELATDNLDATISSRASQVSVNALGSPVQDDDVRLDHLDADITSRSSHSAADVWAVGSRTLTSFGTLVADVALAVWDFLLTAILVDGSIGKLLKDNVDATTSSRLADADYVAPNNVGIGVAASAAGAAALTSDAIADVLDELTEDDGSGNLRYTEKALEEAPSAGGGPTALEIAQMMFSGDAGTYAASHANSVVKQTADNAGGASLTVEDIAEAVWSHDERILTMTLVQVASLLNANRLTVHRGETMALAFTGLGNITGATIWFTAKRKTVDPDTAALIKISSDIGLEVLGGVAMDYEGDPGVPIHTDGSIEIVDAVTGHIIVHLNPVASSLLPEVTGGRYDVQIKDADEAIHSTFAIPMTITGDVTREI